VLGGLALTVDHFRKSAPQRAMMVDFGEAHVFEGQRAQLVEDFLFGRATGLEFTEEFSQGVDVHVSIP
jgi:hypothetical protein